MTTNSILGSILLVDDEPDFLRLAASWLEKQGHHVTTAADGAEALEAFQRQQPDMVLLDLVMPPHRTPETGLGLVPAFTAVPVVVLTAHADQELALQAVEQGAWDFLAKPVEPELLRFVVERALVKTDLEKQLATLKAAQTDEDGIIGTSPAILHLKEMIRRVAPTDLPVIVSGPTGTGKELIAHSLHRNSPRAAAPFVVVNCGAIPGELLESELFGHLRGSFTGAHQDRRGLVTAADGGTLFLDEVGEMPPAMQVKLLRFLQEGTYLPVGGRAEMSADVRIIAASHRDLESMTTEGSLREDFYYRLKGMVLRSPALSDRIEDIAPLAVHFIQNTKGQPPLRLSQDALTWAVSQEWPGNVRELKAVMTCAAALANSTAHSQISAEDLAFARTGETAPQAELPNPQNLAQAIAALERRMITAALAATDNNHSASARQLGMSRVGLLKKMTRLGLR